jgi:hypothetical protein
MLETPRRPATVQVPLRVAVTAAATLVAAGAAIAFLLGRESGRLAATPVPASVSSPPASSLTPPAAGSGEASSTEPASVAQVEGAPAAPAAGLAPALPGSASPTPSAEAQEIARYFRQLDAAESRAKYWDDPEALAKALMDQTSRGDASGFDKLIAADQRAREELQALTVPAACAEHHRQTLGLLDDALALLRRVKDNAVAQDEAGLLAVPTLARELETKARETDRLAADLKRSYGL